jgi:hypothetical protein
MKQITDRNVIDVEAKRPWATNLARGLAELAACVVAWLAWVLVVLAAGAAIFTPLLLIGPFFGFDGGTDTLFSWSGLLIGALAFVLMVVIVLTSESVCGRLQDWLAKAFWRFLRLDPHLIASARRPGSASRKATPDQPQAKEPRQGTLTSSPARLDGHTE